MLGNYINTTISAVTLKSWWDSVSYLPEYAIRRALVLAPRENESPIWPPSGELVRRVAEREAKTPPPARPNYDRLSLTDPELTLPPDNPFYERLEAYKRGDIPRQREADDIVSEVIGCLRQ
jgi:hypothetical protein